MMHSVQDKSGRWYTRREGVVRGPYPAGQISRYILLGRIRESDELSQDQHSWRQVSDCQEMIPEVMKLPPTEENLERLMMARMREDERRPGDRRDQQPDPPESIKERRSGVERRHSEPDLFLRHRQLKQEILKSVARVRPEYKIPGLLAAGILLVLLLGFLTGSEQPDQMAPDCRAAAETGVNWDNCSFPGADIRHADLSGAMIRNAKLDGSQLAGVQFINARLDYSSLAITDLSGADLSNAVLVGASLQGADLRHARLYKTNLAYADLSGADLGGADLTGAVLDHAIWIDRKTCAPGSVGRCERQ